MARDFQIDRAFDQLGGLFAAEHSEHDDEGARQIGRLIRLLRRFKKHEQDERATVTGLLPGAMVREASYGDGTKVWYDSGDAIRDVSDLYTVLDELHGTGSPNLENMQARGLLEHLQRGKGLGEAQVSVLRRLTAKHRAAIDRLRRSPDRHGQDLMDLPDEGAHARIITTKGEPA
jgi:hypothetical protein